jgi:hypothetical protein
MRTIPPNAAAHNELIEGNVGFAIRLRTFAASIANGNLGSTPALELTGFRYQRKSGSGYRLQASRMAISDPNRSFRLVAANVRFRIAMQTLPTKRSLCAAVIGSLVRFPRRKRMWDRSPYLVAL